MIQSSILRLIGDGAKRATVTRRYLATASLSTSLDQPLGGTVPPGNCVFGEDWSPATLVRKVNAGPNTEIFTFKLADESKPLGLSTCACILAKGGEDGEGNPVIRPYTPISTNNLIGEMELMIKIYPEGKFGKHVAELPLGAPVDFKHIPFNVKIQHPFRKKVGMICGGTGVTPMIQALHAVLGDLANTTEVSMLYGSRTADDVLAGPTLDDWAAKSNGMFKVEHVLSEEPVGSSWTGQRGIIGKDLISGFLPPPSSDTSIFVCGPPQMYDVLCGPRAEKEISGLLAAMGYSEDNVVKF